MNGKAEMFTDSSKNRRLQASKTLQIAMAELNDVQFRILDALYFVESFDNILEDAGGPEAVIADELKMLIDQGLVQVMEFDEKIKDFVKSIFYDTDNMRAFHYLATRKGLLKHNSR